MPSTGTRDPKYTERSLTERDLDGQSDLDLVLTSNPAGHEWLNGPGPLARLSLKAYWAIVAMTELTRAFEVQWWLTTTQRTGTLVFDLGDPFIPYQTGWRVRTIASAKQLAAMFEEAGPKQRLSWCHTHLDHECGTTPSTTDEEQFADYAQGLPHTSTLRIISSKGRHCGGPGELRVDLALGGLVGIGSGGLLVPSIPICIDTTPMPDHTRKSVRDWARSMILERVTLREFPKGATEATA